MVLGVWGAPRKRIALPRACPPGRCREPERHARVAAAGSDLADAHGGDFGGQPTAKRQGGERGVGSSRPAEFAIFVTCADTADYPGSTGFLSSKSSSGANSKCWWSPVMRGTFSGRKTHVCDAQRLHEYGLLRASFRPQVEIAALRAYLRQRERLLDYAAAHVQHMQKALTQMNLRLHYVITDITSPLMRQWFCLSLSSAARRMRAAAAYWPRRRTSCTCGRTTVS